MLAASQTSLDARSSADAFLGCLPEAALPKSQLVDARVAVVRARGAIRTSALRALVPMAPRRRIDSFDR